MMAMVKASVRLVGVVGDDDGHGDGHGACGTGNLGAGAAEDGGEKADGNGTVHACNGAKT